MQTSVCNTVLCTSYLRTFWMSCDIIGSIYFPLTTSTKARFSIMQELFDAYTAHNAYNDKNRDSVAHKTLLGKNEFAVADFFENYLPRALDVYNNIEGNSVGGNFFNSTLSNERYYSNNPHERNSLPKAVHMCTDVGICFEDFSAVGKLYVLLFAAHYPVQLYPNFPDDVKSDYDGKIYKRLVDFQQDFEYEHNFHVNDFFEFMQKDFIFHKVYNDCNKDLETLSSVIKQFVLNKTVQASFPVGKNGKFETSIIEDSSSQEYSAQNFIDFLRHVKLDNSIPLDLLYDLYLPDSQVEYVHHIGVDKALKLQEIVLTYEKHLSQKQTPCKH